MKYTYKITGKVDGKWVVEQFDSNDKKTGTKLEFAKASDAWTFWLLENGYTDSVDKVIISTKRAVA